MGKKQSLSPHIGMINFSIQMSSPTEIEAIYIKIKPGKVAKSKEIGPKGEAIVDLDKEGKVLGIEMLAPGHVKIFNKIKKQFKVPELKHFNIDCLQKSFA
jgi:uncharacterized protein YuzE